MNILKSSRIFNIDALGNLTIDDQGSPWVEKNTTRVILTDNEYKLIANYLDNLLKKPSKEKLESPVYTGKQCSIPRYKLKEHFVELGLKKTSCYDYSSTIILDKNFLSSFYEEIIKSLIFTKLCEVELNQKTQTIYENLNVKGQTQRRFYYRGQLSPFNQIKSFYFEETQKYNVSDVSSYLDLKGKGKACYYNKFYKENTKIEFLEILKYLAENPQIKVVFSEDLLVEMNKGGLDLDEEMIKNFEDMLNSKDVSNVTLALESLSNFNLENNVVPIALLMNKYRFLFRWGRGISISKHEGYRILSSFLNNKGIDFKKEWVEFANSLYKKCPESENLIVEYIKSNINRWFENRGGNNILIKELKI